MNLEERINNLFDQGLIEEVFCSECFVPDSECEGLENERGCKLEVLYPINENTTDDQIVKMFKEMHDKCQKK